MASRRSRLINPALWSLAAQSEGSAPTEELPRKQRHNVVDRCVDLPASQTIWQATSRRQPTDQVAAERDRPRDLATTQQPGLELAVCKDVLPAEALALDGSTAQVSASPLLDPALTFRLHSDPTATRIIYLDFDGHTTSGTSWNTSTMGSSFYSPAYDIDGNPASFSDAELANIQQIWQRVASDYAPFAVDVTTQAPPLDWLTKSSSTDAQYGIRAVVTSYGPSSGGAGGIAFVSSFSASQDLPLFVYNNSIVGAAEALSHEVGHSLGLSHDGTALYEYYTGHGSGETGWVPIMGGSYNRSISTWDDGTYTGSNNTGSTANYGKGADDLAVIVGYNGFGYRQDLAGNSLSTATALQISAGSAMQYGSIETRSDSDWFSFQLLDTGNLNLSFNPYWYQALVDTDGVWGGSTSSVLAPASDTNTATPYADHAANLDLAVELYNNQGALLARSNDPGLATHLAVTGLNASTYFLKVDGVGYGDPTANPPTGYSDYGSIGNYWINGTITHAADQAGGGSGSNPLPKLSIANLTKAEGTSSSATTFVVQLVLDAASSNPISVDYRTADETAVSSGTGADYGATSGTLQFAPGVTTSSIAINVVADATVEANESFLINLSNVSGATLATSQARVTISNDDIISGGNGQRRKAKSLINPAPSLAQAPWGEVASPHAVDRLTGLVHNRRRHGALLNDTSKTAATFDGTHAMSREQAALPQSFTGRGLDHLASCVSDHTLPMGQAAESYGLVGAISHNTQAPWLSRL